MAVPVAVCGGDAGSGRIAEMDLPQGSRGASRAAPGRSIQYAAPRACPHHETRAPSGVFSSTIAEAALEASSEQVTFGSKYPRAPVRSAH